MLLKDKTQKDKLEQIYEKYKNRMFVAACRILGDVHKSEDVVHDCFIAIARNIDKIGDVDSASTAAYVIKAARNTALNQRKKGSSEIISDISDEEILSDENTLENLCRQENYNIIVDAIMSLDEKYRDVLSFYYLNELTVFQIAQLLSRKENTVKQQLARGRQKLIKIIEKETELYDR